LKVLVTELNEETGRSSEGGSQVAPKRPMGEVEVPGKRIGRVKQDWWLRRGARTC